MRLFITSTFAAMTLVAGVTASIAQAHAEWRYPFKSAPYAVPHTHTDGATTMPIQKKRTVAKRFKQSLVVKDALIVIAHHKPG